MIQQQLFKLKAKGVNGQVHRGCRRRPRPPRLERPLAAPPSVRCHTRWWPPFCLVVDWAVAAIIAVEIVAAFISTTRALTWNGRSTSRERDAPRVTAARGNQLLVLHRGGRSAEARPSHGIATTLVTEHGVEKHIRSIFQKPRIASGPDDHRRVFAVPTFLRSAAS